MKTLLRDDEVTELSPGYQVASRVFNNLFEHQLIGIRYVDHELPSNINDLLGGCGSCTNKRAAE
jgi:hypothetical protein